MNYELPTSLIVGGEEYAIRSDYRAVLDIFAALNDADLSDEEKALAVLIILYEDYETIRREYWQEAVEQAMWFVNGGKSETKSAKKSPQLVSWEQDFAFIVAPINRVMGQEIRALDYLHWWSFISAYYEIGDCLFAQIVSIRDKKAHGKKLDKAEQEWYRKNREIVDIKRQYTQAEKDALEKLGIK